MPDPISPEMVKEKSWMMKKNMSIKAESISDFDEESKFIGDRLDDACALIFLASEDYDTGRTIIEKEVELVNERKTNSQDPLAVFAVDLCNKNLMKSLKKIASINEIAKDNLDIIFTDDKIKDIYECRKWCLENLPAE